MCLVGKRLSIVVVFLAIATPFARAEKKYTLVTARKPRVGQTTHMVQSGFSSLKSEHFGKLLPEPVNSDEQEKCQLSGVWKVLEIDARGRVGYEITVDRFQYNTNDEEMREVVAPGSVVVVHADGRDRLLNGEYTSKEEFVTPMRSLPEAYDQRYHEVLALFASDVPRAIGETWMLPKKDIHKGCGTRDFSVDADELDLETSEATITLKGIEKVNDVDCFVLTAEIHPSFRLPQSVGAVGITVFKMSRIVEVHLPVEETLPPQSIEVRTQLNTEFTSLQFNGKGHSNSRWAIQLTGEPLTPLRKWTDVSGEFSVMAKLVEATDTGVQLLRTDGTKIVVPPNKLSDADREYLETVP